MTALRRRSMGQDAGLSRTSFIGAVVGVMIAAAVVALLLVVFGDNGSSKKHDNPAAAGAASSAGPSSSAGASLSFATPTPVSSAVPKTSSPTPIASSTHPASTTAAAPKPAPSQHRKPLTYTVKRGDNLFNIAKWFHQHGYGDLYERNKAVIGDDPNLILPGQKITVSTTGMSVSG